MVRLRRHEFSHLQQLSPPSKREQSLGTLHNVLVQHSGHTENPNDFFTLPDCATGVQQLTTCTIDMGSSPNRATPDPKSWSTTLQCTTSSATQLGPGLPKILPMRNDVAQDACIFRKDELSVPTIDSKTSNFRPQYEPVTQQFPLCNYLMSTSSNINCVGSTWNTALED